MERTRSHGVVVQAGVVVAGVPAVLLMAFMLLAVTNLAVDAMLNPGEGSAGQYADPQAFSPVTGLRLGLAVVLVAGYPLVARSRMPDLAKAVLLAAPVGVVTATALVSLYERPALALGAAAATAVVTGIILIATKRPWTWILAAGCAWLLALGYGWPL